MATIARSSSSVNLLQNSYVSIMALAVAALWTVLRQVGCPSHSSQRPCAVSGVNGQNSSMTEIEA